MCDLESVTITIGRRVGLPSYRAGFKPNSEFNFRLGVVFLMSDALALTHLMENLSAGERRGLICQVAWRPNLTTFQVELHTASTTRLGTPSIRHASKSGPPRRQ